MSAPLQQSSSEVRVRFAPSPTGFLHIGGARTALFNWLYARHHGGKFLLRIEDTDLERSEERFTQDILTSLKWLGLNWDEELVFQSKRMDVYRQKAEELLAQGQAYRCYCTEAEVDAMREAAQKAGRKPKYDGRCRERTDPPAGMPYVIRAKLPETGSVEFQDLIRGVIRFENSELDDFVLVRSNGAPTYNFTVVVDDVYQRMTHIIRGDDHINNTPKQLHLYQFFNYPLPKFAHLPMILGADKKKLSKRHGDVSTIAYRGDGYLPEALLNFLVRLGWSHGDQEEFTIEEMIRLFDFDKVQIASGVFNVEKLQWLNGVHLRNAPAKRLQSIVVEDYADFFPPLALERARSELAVRIVGLIQPKVKTLREMAEQLVPLCTPGAIEVDPGGLKFQKNPDQKAVVKAAVASVLETFRTKATSATGKMRSGTEGCWGDRASLEDAGVPATEVDAILRQICAERGVKLGELAEPMRLAVTGRLVSAGLFELMAMLPWDVVESRLERVQGF